MVRGEQFFSHGKHRRTVQRQLILNALEKAEGHLTMEQLAQRVQSISPAVSLSTIYRNVELLLAMGLMRANHLLGEGTTYELADEQSHIHLVCQHCHRVVHLDAKPLEPLQASLQDNVQVAAQFHVTSLAVTVAGYCTSCWNPLSAEHLR
jgi:Fur family transcriptional regulator, ferric uptake regulator